MKAICDVNKESCHEYKSNKLKVDSKNDHCKWCIIEDLQENGTMINDIFLPLPNM